MDQSSPQAVAKRDYTSQEITEAMAIFAMESGREAPVLAALDAVGLQVKIGTLRHWCYKSKRDLYVQISAEVEKAVRAQLADRFGAIATVSTSIQATVLDEIQKRLENADELSTGELGKILHESSVSGGVAFDKWQLANGKPTAIVQQQLPDLARALKARGVTLTIEGQVISEEDVTVGEPTPVPG